MRYLKTFENMALAKSIISKKMEAFDKLKELLKSNLGYIGKFTEYLMNENIPYKELEILFKDLSDLKNKQKNIDISSMSYENVVDKIQSSKNDLSINSLISQFPSEQKNIARELAKNSIGYNLLLKASNSHKKEILITKISRYHTTKDLSNALSLLGKDAINEKEQIKEYLKSSRSAIVFENDEIMIVKVNSITDIQKLGSDTSWCILGPSMWKSYTSGRYQYILYDFTKDDWDPKFKIGFTLNKDFSVHAAHDILDSGASAFLNEVIHKNNIKYSELIPKSEIIEVTEDMIRDIKKSTKIETLKSYCESASKELIPVFIKKLLDVSVDPSPRAISKLPGDIVFGQAKMDMIKLCLNRYFADYEYVKMNDLDRIDPIHRRLSKMIKALQLRDKSILKQKMVNNKPTFNTTDLNPSIIVKMLDYWNDDDMVDVFSRSFVDGLVSIPGVSGWGNVTKFAFKDGWDKEKIKAVSDKLNTIYKAKNWDKAEFLVNNPHYIKYFLRNYILLNYILDRKELVDKSALTKIFESDKLTYSYILKMPIDLSKCDYINKISEWSAPLIIKKDYSDKSIHLNDLASGVILLDQLNGYKLNFKISKSNFDRLCQGFGRIPDSDGKKILNDLLSKFRARKRVNDEVKSEDGKITIKIV